jgi:hypothetical protein
MAVISKVAADDVVAEGAAIAAVTHGRRPLRPLRWRLLLSLL